MLETVDVAPAPAVRWSLSTRVAFRFCFLYFTLYVLTTQMLGGLWIVEKFTPPNMGATGWMQRPIAWTATHVFQVKSQYVTTLTGSGDKTIDWIHAFLLLVVSIAATAAWSIFDRRRPTYASMHKWFFLFLRFAAGTTMVGYGMVKAIPMQMPAPNLTRLLERFGDFSPMGVLWYSVGASFPYERFSGAMELTAAVLLFIPGLSMLGAMVLFADAVQIFVLNMTYDVPVKLFSFHLILIALVLLAPDVRRLWNLLVLDRPVGSSTRLPLARNAKIAWALFAAQVVFGGYVVATSYVEARQAWFARGAGAPKPPLYGIWTIEKMEIDGVERAPLVTDWDRWRRVIFQVSTAMSFQRMDDSFGVFGAKVDTTAKTITLTSGPGTTAAKGTLTYQQPSPDVLILSGTDPAGRKLRLETRLFDRNKFMLVTRGFNWIQERPFNR
jgi:hypothetical protein